MKRSNLWWVPLLVQVLVPALSGCASGKRWVNRPFVRTSDAQGLRLYDSREQQAPSGRSNAPRQPGTERARNAPPPEVEDSGEEGPRPQVRLAGSPSRNRTVALPEGGTLLGVFRNTYYDFPAEFHFEDGSGKRSIIHGPQCQAIAEVPADFYAALCVQGSGTLSSGQTVSFSKRDCSCAQVCPRTGQKICFDALDQGKFPWGRGALGTAITPLSSIAVDSSVIPLGTVVYIPEYEGVERHPGGNPHDGCFVAEDRGMKVVGKHVDVFTGNPSVTEHWNGIVPSNQGVHVYTGIAHCKKSVAAAAANR